MIFKYAELKKFLKFINKNYHVTSLGNWNGSNSIILRHDVDLDVKAAYDLALIEKDCNINSTYFFMTSSHTYNCLSQDNRKQIKDISDLGFEIGLHFDPSIYKYSNTKELKKKVDDEAIILSSITNQPIKSISIHIPSLHGQFPIFEGYNNAYDKQIFSKERYLSDSLMKFSNDIYEFVKNSEKFTIQILLHPMYYTKNGITIPEIFFHFICDFIDKTDKMAKRNLTYAEMMKTDLLSYVSKKVK